MTDFLKKTWGAGDVPQEKDFNNIKEDLVALNNDVTNLQNIKADKSTQEADKSALETKITNLENSKADKSTLEENYISKSNFVSNFHYMLPDNGTKYLYMADGTSLSRTTKTSSAPLENHTYHKRKGNIVSISKYIDTGSSTHNGYKNFGPYLITNTLSESTTSTMTSADIESFVSKDLSGRGSYSLSYSVQGKNLYVTVSMLGGGLISVYVSGTIKLRSLNDEDYKLW